MDEKREGSPRKNNLNVSLYFYELYKCVLTRDTCDTHDRMDVYL